MAATGVAETEVAQPRAARVARSAVAGTGAADTEVARNPDSRRP